MILKKQPQRTCIVCKSENAKKELVRIVKTKEGEISVDLTGKKSGRGAYVCRDKACYGRLFKEKVLHRAFKINVSDEIYTAVEGELDALEQN